MLQILFLDNKMKNFQLFFHKQQQCQPLCLSLTVEYKPYKSAYARDTPQESGPVTSYRCDVCCKDFNGPQPYAMHMKSKAHKEEEEAQQGYM